MKFTNNIKSQIFTLAHAIKNANPALSFSESLKLAWKATKLKMLLRLGEVEFTFLKKNGEVRKAKGTTSPNLFEYTAKSTTPRPTPNTLVKFWDCEKSAFRCCKVENLLSVAA